ncbi:hypothetical protein Solca_0384 [Solitalea canadensis DSM 3403]|uniref:Uncharacterized protein n=1 Tax=Solitalea canadensis (strain ATCC 29591 / DSM 3403 / JCM 21819 / LMG 8368 / NBRC 15130 / NCIMB 12057 / USAM 9D) TaxID=929556 RepID=H8KP02_SOLCM|nr:hypothetical protein Solca_0384 [Solitalea canadensis DSM 3403]
MGSNVKITSLIAVVSIVLRPQQSIQKLYEENY